jgi:hypothetical protein
MAHSTPQAVAGDGSPEPPSDSDVLGRDVTAAEAVDEPAVRPEQRLAPVPGGIADDHGLAPALVVAAHRVLVGHALGQPAHVRHRLVLGGVRIEAGAAERGAERRRVDGHDGPQSRRGIVEEGHLLEPVGLEDLEYR